MIELLQTSQFILQLIIIYKSIYLHVISYTYYTTTIHILYTLHVISCYIIQ